MYQITLEQDGKYHCAGRLQDGTERWVEETLEAAVKSMKRFAKFANGAKIKKRDVEILKLIPVVEYRAVPLR